MRQPSFVEGANGGLESHLCSPIYCVGDRLPAPDADRVRTHSLPRTTDPQNPGVQQSRLDQTGQNRRLAGSASCARPARAGCRPGVEHGGGHDAGRFLLKRRDDMAVGVERERDGGMAPTTHRGPRPPTGPTIGTPTPTSPRSANKAASPANASTCASTPPPWPSPSACGSRKARRLSCGA
jgi:hypothetical protein